LKDEAKVRISDEQFEIRKEEWGKDIPDTKEAYWYRTMFDNVFKPHCADTVKRWIPSWGAPSDPYTLFTTQSDIYRSGRAQSNHAAHTG
jgi:asparagine synthase (glutamine-hydrolysing)